jgi:hypothetical protein
LPKKARSLPKTIELARATSPAPTRSSSYYKSDTATTLTVVIEWPGEPTITTPNQLQATLTKTMTILAGASVRLTQIRARTRL